MEFVRLAVRYVHLVGVALLLGGFAVQVFARQYRVNSAMLYGALTQIVTGLILATPLPRDEQPDPAKLVVKLFIAVMIAAMVIVVRDRPTVAKGHFLAIGGFTLVNIAVATFWV
jgi:uncharacterized membrane protein HdeD (DUF308 family)